MRTILVAGGGYAGFYTAWKLEKKLRQERKIRVLGEPVEPPAQPPVRFEYAQPA